MLRHADGRTLSRDDDALCVSEAASQTDDESASYAIKYMYCCLILHLLERPLFSGVPHQSSNALETAIKERKRKSKKIIVHHDQCRKAFGPEEKLRPRQ